MSKVSQKYQGLKSLCENSVLLHVAPAFQAGTEGRGDTKNARLKGGRYKTVPILSSHTDTKACDVARLDVGAEAPTHKHEESPSITVGMTIQNAAINNANTRSKR